MCAAHRQTDAPNQPDLGLLQPDERALASVSVHGWRYESAAVTYERRTLLIGGPIGFAVSGLVSMAGNRRARRAAEQAAAAQWRPLGSIEVVATTNRLLVLHEGAWWSVWYSAIEHATHDGNRLELRFAADAPYLLVGDVADLAHIIERVFSVDRGAGISSTRGEDLPARDRQATAGEQ